MRNLFVKFLLAAVIAVPVSWSEKAYALEANSVPEASLSDESADPAVHAEKLQSISTDDTISLIVDEGQVLKLPKAVTSVFVANPDIAEVQVKSTSLLYVYGKKVGRTSFYAVDDKDNVVVNRTISVGFNLSALRSAVRKITGSDSVDVGQVEDMILLSGSVDNATTAHDIVRTATRYLPRSIIEAGASAQDDLGRNYIINRMSYSGSNQVNIRVRVAEVSREAIKRLGISTNVANPQLFGDVDVGFGFDAGVTLSGSGANANIGNTWGTTTISGALEALVTDGLATILAEPNLTAISGETANFLAGGEFPIPTITTDGSVNVEYRSYGVRLAFTPTVVNGNRINLRVAPEVSERDDANTVTFSGGTFPGLKTRRAETSVELGSGQSFAIAGLIQNNSSQNIDKYPGLGDLPIIGQLFRSESFRQAQSELVIVVTPYLVKPVTASAMQLPTDGFVPPNDVDRYLDGRMNSVVPTPAPVQIAKPTSSPAEGGLSGQIGYVLQ